MSKSASPTPSRRSLLLQAARRMAHHERHARELGPGNRVYPSCWAVEDVGGETLVNWYRDAMLDGQNDVTKLWGLNNEYSEETYGTRILLLCMAATAERDL